MPELVSRLPDRIVPPKVGPILLPRRAADGTIEGLFLSAHTCQNPTCPCRDVLLTGWLVPFDGTAAHDEKHREGPPGTRVLEAVFGIDTGVVAQNGDGRASEPWALEWLKRELDAELVAALRARFDEAKKPRDWRTEDWSWWEPGVDVSWADIHPQTPLLDWVVDGVSYILTDLYCAEPGCDCREVRATIEREVDEGDARLLGELFFDPTTRKVIEYQPELDEGATPEEEKAAEAELRRAWEAFITGPEPEPSFVARRAEIRGLAKEIHTRFAPPPAPVRREAAKVGRNEPCPCGSGLKYKKCCIDKA